jgi:hypothetical protein
MLVNAEIEKIPEYAPTQPYSIDTYLISEYPRRYCRCMQQKKLRKNINSNISESVRKKRL